MDSSQQVYRNDLWLNTYTLSSSNVMEYFYDSPFFDENSLDQKRRRGEQVSNTPDSIFYELVYESHTLEELEAAAAAANVTPNFLPIFVIVRYRNFKDTQRPETAYYIVAGTIYEAPHFAKVLRHRLGLAADKMCEMFTKVRGLVRLDLACRDGTAVWSSGGPEAEAAALAAGGVDDNNKEERIAVTFGEKKANALDKGLTLVHDLFKESVNRFDDNHRKFQLRYGIGADQDNNGDDGMGEEDEAEVTARLAAEGELIAVNFGGVLTDDADAEATRFYH